MGMVERVARALYPQFFDMEAMRKHTTEPAIVEMQEDARRRARIAITAMREPTEAMADAADREIGPFVAKLIYQDMIDEALK